MNASTLSPQPSALNPAGFLVGIDSDGCAFDTMEVKHKECFIPNLINVYELQAVAKFARETWEFVNLYSKSRGVNRFPALIETLTRLRARPEVIGRGVNVRVPEGLAEWVRTEKRLGNPALKQAVATSGDADLAQALRWSEAVNASVEHIVRGVPPFPLVKECLDKLRQRADMLVVSATPTDALEREWQEHGISQFVQKICGQELGTKKEMLVAAKNYPADHTLMIGDAPGDYAAAKANAALFFPIVPGREDASWRDLYDAGIERFFAGTFAGEYQQRLLEEFDSFLPTDPPWHNG